MRTNIWTLPDDPICVLKYRTLFQKAQIVLLEDRIVVAFANLRVATTTEMDLVTMRPMPSRVSFRRFPRFTAVPFLVIGLLLGWTLLSSSRVRDSMITGRVWSPAADDGTLPGLAAALFSVICGVIIILYSQRKTHYAMFSNINGVNVLNIQLLRGRVEECEDFIDSISSQILIQQRLEKKNQNKLLSTLIRRRRDALIWKRQSAKTSTDTRESSPEPSAGEPPVGTSTDQLPAPPTE